MIISKPRWMLTKKKKLKLILHGSLRIQRLWRTLKCVSMNTCLPCLKSQPMNLGKLSSTTTPRWSIRMRKSIFLRWVLIPIWTHWNLWRTTLSQVSWLSCWSSYSSQYYNNSVVIWIIIITFWIFIFILNIWNPNSEYLNFKHSHIMWMFEYLNMWMLEKSGRHVNIYSHFCLTFPTLCRSSTCRS